MTYASILFLGEPAVDSRTTRFASSLRAAGYDVNVLGAAPTGQTVDARAGVDHVSLRFKAGPLRFAEYFLRSLLHLLFRARIHLVIAEDLYSLPAAYLIAKTHRAFLVFDSRELYSDIASLVARPRVQKIWSRIQRLLAPRCDLVLAVNDSIAAILRSTLTQCVAVVRNVPNLPAEAGVTDGAGHGGVQPRLRERLGIGPEVPILLYQGGLQNGRGIFITLDLLARVQEAVLVYMGAGPLKDALVDEIKLRRLERRAFVIDAVPVEKILTMTTEATLGMSLIENRGRSHFLSLPNKVFEYIAAEVPVVASNFPEMRDLIEQYGVGVAVDPEDVAAAALIVRDLLAAPERMQEMREHCRAAAQELNWQKESRRFIGAVEELLRSRPGSSVPARG